jgi:hypothetical protein
MKSLPDPFPKQYAIYVKEHFSKKIPQEIKDVLWNKLIIFLQNNPLVIEKLSLGYGRFEYSFDGIKLCNLVELGKDDKWAKSIYEDLSKHIPEGQFSTGFGSAFSLGLISYKGTLQRPLFWRIYSDFKDPLIDGFIRQEGFISPENLSKEIHEVYEKILSGDTGWIERNRTTHKDEVFELTIPYSKLWACLDLSQSDGLIGPLQDRVDIDFNKKVDKYFDKQPEKIRVMCSRNFSSIIHEEMFAVYKEANFCKSCGKALPFGTKNKYCPDTPENKDCVKKRARIRKKKGGLK